MKLVRRLILFPLIFGSALVFADVDTGGFYVEPGLTYQIQQSTIHNPSPFNNSTAKVQGFGLMGRVGFHINDMFFVALDARYSIPQYKDSAVSYDTSATTYDLGPSVGVQMPITGLRVWATWIVNSELDPKGTSNVDYKFTGGQGYRVGVGFQVVMVSLNLEYQQINYGNTNFQNASIFSGSSTDSIKYKGDGWIASVSFPIAL